MNDRLRMAVQEQARDLYQQLRHLQLTPSFQYWEMWQPARHGFRETPYPVEWLEERGIPLLLMAEKIRARFGVPADVLSCFRSPAYNKAVGGEDASFHMVGRALDLRIRGVPSTTVHHEILKMYEAKQLPELGGLGLYVSSNFVHIDTRPTGRLARWRQE